MTAPSRVRRWRRIANSLLDGQNKHSFWHRFVDAAIMGAIVVTVIAIVVETLPGVHDRYRPWFLAIEIASVTLFSVEYLARVWGAVEDPTGRFRHPVWGRLKYMATPMALIDLVAILPFFLSMFVAVDLRWLRLMRMLRLLKITRYSPAFATLGAVVHGERRTLASAFLVMAILVLMASIAMYNLEHEAQPEAFGSIPHALWWGVVTMATVGYGDVTPITPAGQVMATFLIFAGVGIFALPTAILAAGFARELQKRDFVISVGRVAKVPVLDRLDAVTLAEIAALLLPVSYPARHLIYRRGEAPDAIYFIVDGEVLIDLPDSHIRMGAGQFFGEMSVLSGTGIRRGTATTLSDCHLLKLPAEAVHDLADGSPQLHAAIAKAAEDRGDLARPGKG